VRRRHSRVVLGVFFFIYFLFLRVDCVWTAWVRAHFFHVCLGSAAQIARTLLADASDATELRMLCVHRTEVRALGIAYMCTGEKSERGREGRGTVCSSIYVCAPLYSMVCCALG
jgi:hypothetical protein